MLYVRVNSTELFKVFLTNYSNRTIVFGLDCSGTLATSEQSNFTEMSTYTKLAYKSLFFTFVLNIAFTLAFCNQVEIISFIALGNLDFLWRANFQFDLANHVIFDILVAAEDHTSL